jgi:hypothetical protein
MHDHLHIHKNDDIHLNIYIRSSQFSDYSLLQLHPFHLAPCSELPISSRGHAAHEKNKITAVWCMELYIHN